LKGDVQNQMAERERMRDAAFEEYAKERAQVDAIV